jgi:hypothetical protein
MKKVYSANVPKAPLNKSNFLLDPIQSILSFLRNKNAMNAAVKHLKKTISIAGKWLTFLMQTFINAKKKIAAIICPTPLLYSSLFFKSRKPIYLFRISEKIKQASKTSSRILFILNMLGFFS